MSQPKMTVRINARRVGARGEYHGVVEDVRTGQTVYYTPQFQTRGAKRAAHITAKKWAEQQGYTVVEG